MPTFQGKPLKVVATANVADTFPSDLFLHCQRLLLTILPEHPYDMFVFEQKDGKWQIRIAGYHFQTNELEEKKIVYQHPSPINPIETLWAKIDDQKDFYSLTFLYPSDY